VDEALVMHAALCVAGLAAGFINVMAGGGSLLTLPVLMLLGLPADVANGTNRLSIVSQSLSGVVGFHRERALDRRSIARVLVPTTLGSLGGALLAAHVPVAALEVVLLGTMVATAALVALAPGLFAAPRDSQPRWDRRTAGFLGLLAAGVYGGFVQAGVGFVLLAVLGGVLRYDLVRASALKLVCTLVFGAGALAVFSAARQVDWLLAGLLAASAVVGSQLGVRFALRVHHGVVRWIVFVTVLATCAAAYLRTW
jgi:uncharacterized protein